MWVPHSLSGPQGGAGRSVLHTLGLPGGGGQGLPRQRTHIFDTKMHIPDGEGGQRVPTAQGTQVTTQSGPLPGTRGGGPREGEAPQGMGICSSDRFCMGGRALGTPAPEGGDLTGLRGLQGGPGRGPWQAGTCLAISLHHVHAGPEEEPQDISKTPQLPIALGDRCPCLRTQAGPRSAPLRRVAALPRSRLGRRQRPGGTGVGGGSAATGGRGGRRGLTW